MAMDAAMICSRNGCELLGEEERESPYEIDGETVCDECYSEWYSENSSTCPFCCNWFLDDELSATFAMTDEDLGEPGLYVPLRYPFYRQGLNGPPGIVHSELQLVGSLLCPSNMEMDGASAAFICKECTGDGEREA